MFPLLNPVDGYKLLKTIKYLPLWLIAGIAISGIVLLFSSLTAYFSIVTIEWLRITTLISVVLMIFKCADVVVHCVMSYRKILELKKTFHATPILDQCYWISSKQRDGSTVTQLLADFMVKNCSQFPVYLVSVRSKFKKEVIQTSILVPDSFIAAGVTLPVRVCICFRRTLPRAWTQKAFETKLYLADSGGNEQKVRVFFKNVPQSQKQA
jgi:hypothetical protein